jgi:short-subunit dehydrogenase
MSRVDQNSIQAVIITGGSSGIGEQFIQQALQWPRPPAICNLSRRQPQGFSEADPRLRHLPCDLSDAEQLDRATQKLLSWLGEQAPPGQVLLIHNSGFGSYGPFADLDIRGQRDMMAVNMQAVVELTSAVLPVLKQRGGAILTVASTAAFQPTPTMATYGATKAFLLSWSLSLHEELRGGGVSVLCVCPGPTRTDFFRASGFGDQELPGQMTSAQVARAAFKALWRGRSLVVTGTPNRLLVSASSLAPRSWAARLTASVLKRTRKCPQ